MDMFHCSICERQGLVGLSSASFVSLSFACTFLDSYFLFSFILGYYDIRLQCSYRPYFFLIGKVHFFFINNSDK